MLTFAGAIKITQVLYYKQTFKRMTKIIHDGVFKPDVERGTEEEERAIRRTIKRTEKQVDSFCLMCTLNRTTSHPKYQK